MRKVFIQLLFTVLPLSLVAQNNDLQKKDTIYDEGKGVQFLEISYEQALAKAKAENKRIFIDCYASWCAPCKENAEYHLQRHPYRKLHELPVRHHQSQYGKSR